VIGFMAAVEGIPRSVILINWLLSLVVIGGLRVVLRRLLGGSRKKIKKGTSAAGALKIANTNSKSLLGKYHSPNRTENAINSVTTNSILSSDIIINCL
jgi:FlaA1/EpsC-like NDP-sugar epimerase